MSGFMSRGVPAPVGANMGYWLSLRERLSYAAGSIASNLSWNFVAGFLLVYYTDVALLPVASVGTLLLLTRSFDAIFDPIVGTFIDKTRTRWGKTRPYLLFAAVPFGLISILVFSVPSGSVNMKLIYAYLTFGLLGVLYSFLYVPYGALQPLLTTNKHQLLSVSGMRAMGTSIASIFVYVLALPAVKFFGGGAIGYRGAATLFAICTIGLYWLTFLNCRERVAETSQIDRSPLNIALPNMFRNPIWLIVMLFELLIFIRLGVFASSMVFYARLVLGDVATVGFLLPTLSIGILTGGLISAPFLRRFAVRRGIIYLNIFTIACFALVPFFGRELVPFIAILFFGAIGNGIQAAMSYTLIAEAVELQEARFGKRDAGLLTSVASFNQKVGFAIGGSLVAWALASVGYRPGVSSIKVSDAVIWLMCGVPIIIALLQILTISQYRFDGVKIARSDD